MLLEVCGFLEISGLRRDFRHNGLASAESFEGSRLSSLIARWERLLARWRGRPSLRAGDRFRQVLAEFDWDLSSIVIFLMWSLIGGNT